MSDNIELKEIKNSYSKDKVVIRQGDNSNQIYLLTEGEIEARVAKAKDEISIISDNDIISADPLFIIKAPAVISSVDSFEPDSNGIDYSFVALTDCTVVSYKFESDYQASFKKNISLFFKILLTIKDSSLRAINEIKKVIRFDKEIEKCSDNFGIVYEYFAKIEDGDFLGVFKSNGGEVPTKIEKQFLIDNHAVLLNTEYSSDEKNIFKKIDTKKVEFYTSLIRTKPEALAAIINLDFKVYKYIFSDLLLFYNKTVRELYMISSNTKKDLKNFFFATDSNFNKIYSIENRIKSNINAGIPLLKNIILVSKTLEHYGKELLGIEFEGIGNKYSKMLKVEEEKKNTGVYKLKYKDSAMKIIDYSTLSDERKEAIVNAINDLGTVDLSDSTTKEVRQLARKLQAIFDELYLDIFFKAILDTAIPMPVKLFLYFGFISEKYLTDDQMETLEEALPSFSRENYESLEYSVIPLFDYLQLIYNEDESPGLSAMGEEFNKLLRKNAGLKGNTLEDTPESKTKFELENMIKESMRITSDNPRAFIPFLIEESFRATLSTIVNTPEKMQKYIGDINHVDYGLFFRELTWKIPGKTELIKKEVKPYFVVVPNSGIRVQLWQELINNIRASRGRFVVPAIFNGDLKRSLTTALAHFRWELNKIIAGANWMSPVDGGFVGAFYDYTQYYHKNNDISIETKEDIKILFNKIKIDRDRFAHDYHLWVNYEKDGIPKLNRVVRTMFYRYIPFPKEIRDKICKLPIFEELDIKFNNIRNRELKSIEVKYNKYKQKGDLPEDLQKYLDYMKG